MRIQLTTPWEKYGLNNLTNINGSFLAESEKVQFSRVIFNSVAHTNFPSLDVLALMLIG